MNYGERVRGIIAEALYLDVSEVELSSNLMKDLGAESIDFLDIVFRLEKEFEIRLPKGEIERRAQGDLNGDEFAVSGRLTPQALQRLTALMPEVEAGQIQPGLLVRDIPTLFTVTTFLRMVEDKLCEPLQEQVASASMADAPAL